MAEWIFWIAVFLVGYSYALYPLVLVGIARLRSQPLEPLRHSQDTPAVACIIAAYNEERHIAARIDNVRDQQYDANKLTLYVGSDGSRDRTPELLRQREDARVRSFIFERNRGKASVLNDLVAASTEPILVFSDANAMFAPDAVARLVARFSDPAVGAVSGELKLLDAAGSNQDSAYWRFEQVLKRNEAKIGGLLGANGAIYALRREAWKTLSADTIVDDFCTTMTAAAAGWKLVYEPEAVALEDTPDDISDEYHRRVRIGIGNYQAFFRHPEYLTRTNWPTRFAYVSHKVLRWFAPHLMLIALAASAYAAQRSHLYFALFMLQIASYAAAVVVRQLGLDGSLPKYARMVLMLLTLNFAFLVAFAKYVTGRYSGSWRTTARGPQTSGSSPT